jgi:hypothetical protein
VSSTLDQGRTLGRCAVATDRRDDRSRFLTRDPIESLTREPYGYVRGNPLNAVDPLGLYPGEGLVNGAGRAVGGAARGTGRFVKDHADVIVAGVVVVGAGACIVVTEGACAVAIGQGLAYTVAGVTTAGVVGLGVYDAHEFGELVRHGDRHGRRRSTGRSVCEPGGPVYTRPSPPADAWDRFGNAMLGLIGVGSPDQLLDPAPGSGQFQPTLRPWPGRVPFV